MCGIGTDWMVAGAENEAKNAPLTQTEPPQKNALIIFVKNPQLGKVKTRLAKTMGDEAALDAYLKMLAHVRNVAAQLDCHRAVFYADFVDEADAWTRPTFSKHVQASGDLGEKMHGAIAEMLQEGYEKVVLMGSDFLDIEVQHLAQAFRALEFSDIVLGPTEDGGYYLIGMKAPHPSLFLNKTWSTSTVKENALAEIRQLGESVHLLRSLADIDEEIDWQTEWEKYQARHGLT